MRPLPRRPASRSSASSPPAASPGWRLTVNGQSLEPLASEVKEPYRAIFVGRVPRSDGYADSPLIVERVREVRSGLLEQITVRNYSLIPVD